ncbi:MAG TPA: formate C-acetyltransferase [Syntrophomonadaceae bacterium]|nr:formate C-acetyltransferase [Syntrophomonadaceae bacterium]HPR94515.1 formate C-acetyltransferase [Syntrophomonadaceae bacterium]
MQYSAWEGFNAGEWVREVNVSDFIDKNYTPYEGDEAFLASPTERTVKLWDKVKQLMWQEHQQNGVLDIDTRTVSSITSHAPGYVDRELEIIVGLQTDAPLKRAVMPAGGIRLVNAALEAYGYETDPEMERTFTRYRKTHNQGVFDAYTPEIRLARKAGIITGLPDAYGRGRIIGDYRRVALYGVDFLVQDRISLQKSLNRPVFSEEVIQMREELSEGIKALKELKAMATSYGFDISRPARNAREAAQFIYFAYLATVKEQNGAAMSLGRISAFLDIYFARDLDKGDLNESAAQEIIDQLVMKLRMVRFLRTPEYNELFSGDPVWVTEALGGMGVDGRTRVTKTAYRMLHTLTNLGPAPEPNLTVLWSQHLPAAFKKYCARISIQTSSIQYENDDLMRPLWGDDYAIACCVSAMRVGKQMQFFGARVNLAKALLYAVNGGTDEILGKQITPRYAPITSEYLDFDELWENYEEILEWLAQVYVNTMNIIHYMHDKYDFERLQFALHDLQIHRTMAFGIAGLSVVADSLSAVKYARVKVFRNSAGVAIDFAVEGEFPTFGNNDPRADDLAVLVQKTFMNKLMKYPAYRKAHHTMSILTITSNVVYGRKTGSTPDGRKAGEPFAPGANPMHGRDHQGALASMSSVARLPYEYALDGISYTFSIVPGGLGREPQERIQNLAAVLDGYFLSGGHHINVNVLEKATLEDAMQHPEKYPQLTIRVSGYAVNFIKLSREQQLDVIHRTFHTRM